MIQLFKIKGKGSKRYFGNSISIQKVALVESKGTTFFIKYFKSLIKIHFDSPKYNKKVTYFPQSFLLKTHFQKVQFHPFHTIYLFRKNWK
jgi:hypothetical protein